MEKHDFIETDFIELLYSLGCNFYSTVFNCLMNLIIDKQAGET